MRNTPKLMVFTTYTVHSLATGQRRSASFFFFKVHCPKECANKETLHALFGTKNHAPLHWWLFYEFLNKDLILPFFREMGIPLRRCAIKVSTSCTTTCFGMYLVQAFLYSSTWKYLGKKCLPFILRIPFCIYVFYQVVPSISNSLP